MINSILLAVVGGALIGLSASAMLFFLGRITGISGIVGGILKPTSGDISWRLTFLGGLLAGGLLLVAFMPDAFHVPATRSQGALALAGLLVGFGVRMGNGCTSGHGICGLSRFSPRSIVATGTFMAVGMATATLIHLISGAVL